jgi:hypothetical protein
MFHLSERWRSTAKRPTFDLFQESGDTRPQQYLDISLDPKRKSKRSRVIFIHSAAKCAAQAHQFTVE